MSSQPILNQWGQSVFFQDISVGVMSGNQGVSQLDLVLVQRVRAKWNSYRSQW